MPKKTKRPYDSTRRQAQAQETRAQVLRAARELFIEKGYGGATMEAIAQNAGVAAETVYAAFGNKRTLLGKLIQVAVGGDEAPIGLLERPERKAVLSEQDPKRMLKLFARDISSIQSRVAPVYEVVRTAAKTEPEAAQSLEALLQARFQNLSAFVMHLSAQTALRKGMDTTRASETVWVLTSAEVYHLLTVKRGWSQEQFVEWLGDSLTRLLLP